MGKQKQQVISRFFSPQSKSPSSPPPSFPLPSLQNPSLRSPKIAATVSFSPAKRRLTSSLASPQRTKTPKLSHIETPVYPTLHQKFLQKLLEPPEQELEQSSHLDDHKSNAKYTPLEQQVVELKKKYSDVLLMVEVGYKFRFFGKDAEIAARVLGIYAHVDHNFLTASVPTFRLNVHVRRLVNAGYKVGVVKQTETAAIKAHGSNKLGPFCRGLSALYTKATLEAAEELGGGEEGCGGESNYLACIVEEEVVSKNTDCALESGFDVRIGIVAVEISTGDVVHGEFNDNFMRSGLEAVILSLSPVELLLGMPVSKFTEKTLLAYAGCASHVRVEHASRDCFKEGGALAEVASMYETIRNNCEKSQQYNSVSNEDGQPAAIEGIMDLPTLSVQALALAFQHLKQFGLERIVTLGASFRPFSSSVEMTLSGNALYQLQVLNDDSDGFESSGSLFQTMNHTLTVFGSRLLKQWVTHPLCDRGTIYLRLDAVSEIVEAMGYSKASCNLGVVEVDGNGISGQAEVHVMLSSVLATLGRYPDVQRGITRIFHGTASASEFIAVIQAVLFAGRNLQQLVIEEDANVADTRRTKIKSSLLRKLTSTASSPNLIGNAAKFLSCLNKEAADKGDLLNLFNNPESRFPEVARAQAAVQLSKGKLDLLIHTYREQLGMNNLQFASVSGSSHLIELPLDVTVPSNWVKVSSTKKTVRYHPPEVIVALDDFALVNEELALTCRTAWESFLTDFSKFYFEFQAAAQALAALDCLYSLAILAKSKNYVRPVFVDDYELAQIHISSGRHPVLETILEDKFVPNDTYLRADAEYCQIVTGPNMGGKSCYIRQVALIILMAQVGSFVPATSTKLHVVDGIYTRIGASDSIQKGRSTFMEELSEASLILNKCTSRSLVIIDELGRGTSTHDGVAIAYATLYHLLQQKKCMTLFVTHYPKIVDIKDDVPGCVGAYHVSYLTSQKKSDIKSADCYLNGDEASVDHEDVTYLYKVVPGISARSFGFKVAELAQLPPTCISRGIMMAEKLDDMIRRRNRVGAVQPEGPDLGQEGQACTSSLVASHINKDCIEKYRTFFGLLGSALGEDDLSKSFEILKHAACFSEEMLSCNTK